MWSRMLVESGIKRLTLRFKPKLSKPKLRFSRDEPLSCLLCHRIRRSATLCCYIIYTFDMLFPLSFVVKNHVFRINVLCMTGTLTIPNQLQAKVTKNIDAVSSRCVKKCLLLGIAVACAHLTEWLLLQLLCKLLLKILSCST